MKALPTVRELEEAGTDAGAVLDACEAELERAIPMTADKEGRIALAADLERLHALRAERFPATETTTAEDNRRQADEMSRAGFRAAAAIKRPRPGA